jgi:hypothetical protein
MKNTISLYLFFLVILIIGYVNSTPFYPIEAGTFEISSNDLIGLGKVTKKQIIL